MHIPFTSAMYNAAMDVGMATTLMDATRTVTMFAPTDEAFSLMRDPSVPNPGPNSGQNILDDRRNIEVLKRVGPLWFRTSVFG